MCRLPGCAFDLVIRASSRRAEQTWPFLNDERSALPSRGPALGVVGGEEHAPLEFRAVMLHFTLPPIFPGTESGDVVTIRTELQGDGTAKRSQLGMRQAFVKPTPTPIMGKPVNFASRMSPGWTTRRGPRGPSGRMPMCESLLALTIRIM